MVSFSKSKLVDHHGAMLLPVRTGVLQLEALGQLAVQLDGAALPGPAQAVFDMEVQLGSVESAVPFIDDEGLAHGGDGVLQDMKKVLLANAIGALWDVYKAMDPSALSVADAWLGAVAFTFQIYFDFSGYSDMAIGLGRMLGFEFPENFRYPYLADSITDFWRRWHITLSSWFRDYVYIPLGGNRKGLKRQLLNLLIVWCLTGIWHGASWNYLLWGLYYALLLMLEKAFLLRRLDRGPRWIAHLYTLILVVIGWVVFSLEDLGQCAGYLAALFGGGEGLVSSVFLYYLRSFAPTLVILALCATPLPRRIFDRLPEKVRGCAAPILMLGCLVLVTAYLVDGSYNPFLYFRF